MTQVPPRSAVGSPSGSAASAALLDPAVLRKIEALSLGARRAFTGASKGEKRSTKRGTSVEFADFRPYNMGDDLRRIDWNAYGRFEKLFLKMFMEEEDLDLTLILDASRSMGFGSPTKLLAAARLVGAVGYVGLHNFDRVRGVVFDDKVRAWFPPARGKGAAHQLFRFLGAQEARGSGDLPGACKRVAAQAQRAGIAIVASDFLMESGYEVGLRTLAARGFEVTALQVLDRQELEPTITGDLKLVDAETGAIKEVSVSDALLRTYKRNLDAHCAGLKAFCRRYGMNYLLVANDTPADAVLLRMMRSAGVVQ